MADWNVNVDNQVEVQLDSDTFALLTEIRDLLKQMVERLPHPTSEPPK